MTTRRIAYWWFWCVISGRFFGKFLEPASPKPLSASLSQGIRSRNEAHVGTTVVIGLE